MTHTKVLNAKQVALYFLFKSKEGNKTISNKKLQKLLYYAQAWSMVLRKKKLFSDQIEAWVHGPAIRGIYLEYKKFGFGPIEKKVDQKTILNISSEVRNFLDQIWNVYGKFDPAFLEQLTHSEAPWQMAREGLEPHMGSGNIISLNSMRDFYSLKLKKV
jgi:uncharacterized phage-associated protein